MRSELNFPVGSKYPLDFGSQLGLKWVVEADSTGYKGVEIDNAALSTALQHKLDSHQKLNFARTEVQLPSKWRPPL